MNGTKNIILSDITKPQRNTHGMHSLIVDIIPKLRISVKQFTDHMKLNKKEDQSVNASVLLRMRNKILTGGIRGKKCGGD